MSADQQVGWRAMQLTRRELLLAFSKDKPENSFSAERQKPPRFVLEFRRVVCCSCVTADRGSNIATCALPATPCREPSPRSLATTTRAWARRRPQRSCLTRVWRLPALSCVPMPMPYPIAPLWQRLSPAEVGAFVTYRATPLTKLQFEELQSFVGWALELLVQPPESTYQLRYQLRMWQRKLQVSTYGCNLTWTEAFAVHGLQFWRNEKADEVQQEDTKESERQGRDTHTHSRVTDLRPIPGAHDRKQTLYIICWYLISFCSWLCIGYFCGIGAWTAQVCKRRLEAGTTKAQVARRETEAAPHDQVKNTAEKVASLTTVYAGNMSETGRVFNTAWKMHGLFKV